MKAFSDERRSEDIPIDGVWINNFRPGFNILLAEYGNHKFNDAFNKHSRPIRRKIDSGKLPSVKQTELLNKIMAKTVFLGFSGDNAVDPKTNEPVPNTEQVRYELLRDYPDFRDDVMDAANNLSNELSEEVEEIEGN